MTFDDWMEADASDAFCRDLAKIAAKQLKRLDSKDREEGKMVLQDATSLYSPYTASLIGVALRGKARA